MSWLVRIGLLALGLIFITFVWRAMVKRKVTEANGLIWMAFGLGVFVCGLIPNIVVGVAAFLGIDYPPTAFFVLAIVVLMFIVFRNSMRISELDMQTRELAMHISLLNQENERLLQEAVKLTGKDKTEL